MVKRIYVGNLPWSVTKVKLEELFGRFGEMEDALVISDKYTGKSRGFGFVTYKKDSDAEKAMSEMNKKEIEEREIVVREARPMRSEQESEGDKSESGDGEKLKPEHKDPDEVQVPEAEPEEVKKPIETKKKPAKRGRKKKES